MTFEISKYLEYLKSLDGALPEIKEAAQKIGTYDEYASNGGSESEARDYFEVQRIVDRLENSISKIPPKIPLRNDYEFLSESLCYFLNIKAHARVSIEELKGLLLPKNISLGELKEIESFANRSVRNLFLPSDGEYFVYLPYLKDKLKDRIGASSHEALKKIVGSDRSLEKQEIPPAVPLTKEQEIIQRAKKRNAVEGPKIIVDMEQFTDFIGEELSAGYSANANDEVIQETVQKLISD